MHVPLIIKWSIEEHMISRYCKSSIRQSDSTNHYVHKEVKKWGPRHRTEPCQAVEITDNSIEVAITYMGNMLAVTGRKRTLFHFFGLNLISSPTIMHWIFRPKVGIQ